MKKACLMIWLALLVARILGTPSFVVAVPVPAECRSGSAGLRLEWLESLSGGGLQIYHIDDDFVIAGSSSADHPGARFLCGTDGEGLYLLSTRRTNHTGNLRGDCTLLLKMSSGLLIQSSIPEQELRELYPVRLMRLPMVPLKLNSSNIDTAGAGRSLNFITEMLRVW